MGSSQSTLSSNSSGARFVNDGLPAVQSYRRCHIFGDASLYSIGIRTGYYLHYLAAVLCILFLRGQDLKAWYLSFVPLAAAHLVVLVINATGSGLIVLDWQIVFALVFWCFVFLLRSVFYKASRRLNLGSVRDSRKLQLELAREGGRSVSDQETEWNKRYIVVVKAFGAEASRDGNGGRRVALEQALHDYVEAFASSRASPGYGEASSYMLDIYEDDDRIRDTAARMMITNTEIESFRDAHAEALRLADIPYDQVQSTTTMLAKLAMEDLYPPMPPRSRRSMVHVMADFEGWAGTTGLLGCGLALVLYAAYLGLSIWVLFRGIDLGRKGGCDVRIIFLVVPISTYNSAALTTLRVLACIWLGLAGVPALLGGLVFLMVGIYGRWTETSFFRRLGNKGRKGEDPSVFKAVAYDAEKGKKPVATGSSSAPRLPGVFRGSRRSNTFFEASGFPAQQPSTSSFKKETEGGPMDDLALEEKTETAPGVMRGGGAASALGTLWIILKSKWEVVFLLPLVHTIVAVEMTIRINHLDMRQQRAFGSFPELLAFFLGAFLLLRVLGQCLFRAAQEARRRRSAGWFQERWRVLMDRPRPVARGGGVHPSAATPGSGGIVGRGGGGVVRKDSQGLEKVQTWQTSGRLSGSSLGKFKEMIDEG